MATANFINLIRNRIQNDYKFPLKFSMCSSSGKMHLAPDKFQKYIDTRIYKHVDLKDIFSDDIKGEVQKSFSVLSDPSIYDDEKPRYSIGCIYNKEEGNIRQIIFTFVKTGKTIEVAHRILSSEAKYDTNWIFFCHFDSDFHLLDFANSGASEDDIINTLGSGFRTIMASNEYPQLNNAMNSSRDL